LSKILGSIFIKGGKTVHHPIAQQPASPKFKKVVSSYTESQIFVIEQSKKNLILKNLGLSLLGFFNIIKTVFNVT
jgi:hypothetical protein